MIADRIFFVLLKQLSLRIKIIYAVFFIFILSLPITLKGFNENKTIMCGSSFIIYKDDIYIKVFIKYYIFSDDGFVNLNGSMFKSDKFIRDISFKVSFDYTKKGNSFYLHSTNVDSSLLNDLDSTPIENYLPLFYLKKNTNWSIGILKQEANYFVFLSDSTPSFLCLSKN
ncbi:hypothetical protein [Serratia sp. Res13-Sevr-LER1-36-b]|uniref:hypothetical protein n=2 Tax=unclassified Serratia (in: enterobacteria) TaxID=2647522 RepID=UPI0018A910D4|nr:hypothetical protein [Serratia sp. Res13-Sevr-LER1-36-b]